MKTTRLNEIYLGKKDRLSYYLKAPSRECGWYRGLGYVTTRYSHEHFDNSGLVLLQGWNNEKGILDEFADNLKDQSKRWDLIAIMRHCYHLKERAEFLKNGGHVNNYSISLLNNIDSEENRKKEIEKINNELLPKLFDTIQHLFGNQ